MSNICIYMMKDSIKDVLNALLDNKFCGNFLGVGDICYGNDKVVYPKPIQFALRGGQVTRLCIGPSSYLEKDEENKNIPFDVLSVLQDLKTKDLRVDIGKKIADGDTLNYYTIIIRDYRGYVGS